jgi:hypothetical protein
MTRKSQKGGALLAGAPIERWIQKLITQAIAIDIRFEMGPLEPDPSKLQLLNVTSLVRINRDPLLRYGD